MKCQSCFPSSPGWTQVSDSWESLPGCLESFSPRFAKGGWLAESAAEAPSRGEGVLFLEENQGAVEIQKGGDCEWGGAAIFMSVFLGERRCFSEGLPWQ